MSVSVAIVGATGVVGEELLAILAERAFPVGELGLFASPRSVGRSLEFGARRIAVKETDPQEVARYQIAFLSAGASVSRLLRPALAAAGTLVADNTSAYRLDPDVPLVVPEINPGSMGPETPWVAVPNCTAILLNLALAPLERAFGLKRVVVSTYQAVSGAGRSALEMLEAQVKGLSPEEDRAGAVPLAFNVIPAIGEGRMRDDGDGWETGEEQKVIAETRRLLERPDLEMGVTCVRVPVRRAHSESVWVEFRRDPDRAALCRILGQAAGVDLLGMEALDSFPHPVAATGLDGIRLGRLRRSAGGWSFFLAGDQLRKGAALNAVQIAEIHCSRSGETPPPSTEVA